MDATDDGRGGFRTVVIPDGMEPWPDARYLRQGARANARILLNQVSVPVRAAPPLVLTEVLEAVAQTHPTLEAADQNVVRAEGRALSARGGFDPTLKAQSKWNPVGAYKNTQIDASVR